MRAQRDQKKRAYLRLRIITLGAVFGLAFVVLLVRSVDLQVMDQEDLKAKAKREIFKLVKLQARRGIIYDRDMRELAISLRTSSVYASPQDIKKPREVSRRLAKALGMKRSAIYKKLKEKRGFVWIARRVPPEKALAVREANLWGVGMVPEPRRFYPYGKLAGHVLGIAGMDAKGLEGLERKYNKELKGRGSTVMSMRDGLRRTVHISKSAFTTLPEGNRLVLTIDGVLQHYTEKVLQKCIKEQRAKGGRALVMDPKTGAVLAAAVYPDFNPNTFEKYSKSRLRNRLVTDAYEPGSTFKIFVAAAALNSGTIPPSRRFYCEEGSWVVGGRTLHDTHKYGNLNLTEIIKLSSNIGAGKIGMALGAEQINRTIRAFGFGRHTRVDLPGESRGILRPVNSWRPVELANICFGQGIAVTPMQLTQAVAAIANRGLMMQPHVVKARLDRFGKLIQPIKPQAKGRVMGEAEAKALTRMMVEVTTEGGTGTQARVEPFSVAGKTGTAQKVKPGGGYSRSDYMSSFIGFAPAENPKAVVLVVIDTPRKNHYGGVVAGPAFAKIMRRTLDHLGLSASRPQEALKETSPGVQLIADRRINSELANASLTLGRAPDLSGMTLRQALDLAGRAGVALKIKGWGRVVGQKPAPGAELKKSLFVRLQPRGGGI